MVRPYSIKRFKGNDNDNESSEVAAPSKRTMGGFVYYSWTFSFQEEYFAESDLQGIEHKANSSNKK